jgi:hypothetical protein
MDHSGGEMPCGKNWLEEEPIDRLVRIFERCQVDLAVPAGQEFVIGNQARGKRLVKEDA